MVLTIICGGAVHQVDADDILVLRRLEQWYGRKKRAKYGGVGRGGK